MSRAVTGSPFARDALALPESLGGVGPSLAEASTRLAALVWDPGRGGLRPHLREIAGVAVLAYLGSPAIGAQMRRALEAGATVREIAEALIAIATPGGQRSLANGLAALSEIVNEEGAAALAAPANPVAAVTGREVTPASPWPWLDQHYPGYQAARRDINALSFVPDEAALAPKYREILVALVLSCRRYPTQAQHLRRAIAEGATFDEIADAFDVAAVFGGAALLAHAMPVLTAIRADIEAGRLAPA